MTTSKPNLLVGTDVVDRKNIDRLSEYSTVYTLADLMGDQLARILPTIDVLLVFSWPRELTQESLEKMTRLKFLQSILAGVNHIPFASLNKGVIVSSNAGAYSDEVAEYALALLLSAAKRIGEVHPKTDTRRWDRGHHSQREGTRHTRVWRNRDLGGEDGPWFRYARVRLL